MVIRKFYPQFILPRLIMRELKLSLENIGQLKEKQKKFAYTI